jgi:DNA-binding IscR family transcriptional regulator
MTKSKNFATAIHIMTLLAFNERLKLKPCLSSEHIAESLQANPSLVRRMLSILSKAELIDTQMGKSGGARLSSKREKINLREIYETIEPGALLKTLR